MLNEAQIYNSPRDKAIFMMSLLKTLGLLKSNDNVDDVYLNFNNDKMEIYVFTYTENFDTENFISKTITEWEQEQLYFPELFIYEEACKMNVLPRSVIKVC